MLSNLSLSKINMLSLTTFAFVNNGTIDIHSENDLMYTLVLADTSFWCTNCYQIYHNTNQNVKPNYICICTQRYYRHLFCNSLMYKLVLADTSFDALSAAKFIFITNNNLKLKHSQRYYRNLFWNSLRYTPGLANTSFDAPNAAKFINNTNQNVKPNFICICKQRY